MSPLLAALLLAAGPTNADAPTAAIVERAIEAVGGHQALADQRTLSLQATTTKHIEQLLFVDLVADGVRVEHKLKRKTTSVRGRAGNLAWDFRSGAIPADRLAFTERVWLPARTLLDKAKVERVVGAPKGQTRLLLSYKSGEMLYLDIHERTGRVVRLEGFEHASGASRTVVVRYSDWKRFGGHWLPAKLSVKRNGQPAFTRVIKAARFNAPMTPHFFMAPRVKVDL